MEVHYITVGKLPGMTLVLPVIFKYLALGYNSNEGTQENQLRFSIRNSSSIENSKT